MPRSGGGIYSKGSPSVVSGTTIQSAAYNTTIDDLVTDANAARPVSAGGTGAANAADARTNLGISATNTPFTPAGNIAATNTQAAIAELDTEKAALTGATFTGGISGTTGTFSGVVSGAAASADGHLLNRITADVRYLGETYRNRIINPAMQISQERGTTLVDVTTSGAYTVDQWVVGLSTTPGGTLRVQQVASATPGGSPFRLRHTAQVADASIAAGDRYTIIQYIEGQMVADARFGTASARQIVIRFGVRSSLAGTFGVRLCNGAFNRSYVTTITIAGGEINTDLVRTIVIPGDTSGTWLTDTGIGFDLRITLAAGTTFQTTAGSWQAGDLFTTSGQTNFMGTASATFELFDVGLYVDALAIGAAPSWELPAWDADLRACQRYYETFSTTEILWSIDATNAQSYSFGVPYRVIKRTGTPSVALTNNMTGFNAPTLALANATGFRVSAVCNVTATARAFSFAATVTDRF
jgi:hypothetical protein